jgi:hypothetical protein
MRQSESIAKLAAALVKAQAEVQNATKDSKNPHFKSSYASLASVLDTTKPVLAKYGLAVVQMPGFADGCATLDCVIVHESGEWMGGTAGAPLQKNDPQGVGSALTYLRRYSLAALAGITQEDDDGNAASHGQSNGGYAKPEFITASQVADLEALLDEVQADRTKFLAFLHVPALDRLQKIEYPKAVKALEQKRAAK